MQSAFLLFFVSRFDVCPLIMDLICHFKFESKYGKVIDRNKCQITKVEALFVSSRRGFTI